MSFVRSLRSLTLAFIALATPAAAAWPEKPIRIYMGAQAGSTIDIIGRMLGNHLQDKFRQAVVIENRPGGGGFAVTKHVATQPPDGYSLLLGGSLAAFEVTLKEAAGISNDFTFISFVRKQPSWIGVSTRRGFNSLRDLIAFGKANPKTLNYGSFARSLEFYLTTFNRAAGFEAVHVPFRGSVDAVTALANGEIDYYLDSLVIFEPFVQQGKVKVMAASTQQRSADRPEIPSLADAGVTGLDIFSAFGLLGPKGMSGEVVDALNDGVKSFAALPDVRAKLVSAGLGAAAHSTPAELRAYVDMELKVLRDAAAFAGVTPQ